MQLSPGLKSYYKQTLSKVECSKSRLGSALGVGAGSEETPVGEPALTHSTNASAQRVRRETDLY